jgi:hypothetical protein
MRAAIGLAPLSSVAARCRLADSHHDPAADSSAGGDACRVSLRLLVLPPVIFLVLYRFPFAAPRNWRAERRNVHLTNLSLVALYGALAATLGSGPSGDSAARRHCAASIVGVRLLSLQHHFDRTHWARHAQWVPVDAALRGSVALCCGTRCAGGWSPLPTQSARTCRQGVGERALHQQSNYWPRAVTK